MLQIPKNLINKIKSKILNLVKKDQTMRYSNKFDKTIDQINTKKLKKIILQIGWPKISMVGKKVANGAWLLVQHADHDIKFQEHCLSLMREAFKQNEVEQRLLAYLVDRVLVNKKQKQIYGTQFYKNEKTGKLIPKPIKNKKHIDNLRASVGLESLESYGKTLNESVAKIEHSSKR